MAIIKYIAYKSPVYQVSIVIYFLLYNNSADMIYSLTLFWGFICNLFVLSLSISDTFFKGLNYKGFDDISI